MNKINPDYMDPQTGPGKDMGIVLRFPDACQVNKLDDHAVLVKWIGEPAAEMFTPQFIADLEKTLGTLPAQIWIEDTLERLAKELLMKQIR